MKTIFTLIASMILSLGLLAAGPGGKIAPVFTEKAAKPATMLTIRSADRGDIRVVIDGRRFEPNRNFLRIQNLRPGSHRVKIYRERSGGMFNMFGKRYELVFNSSIQVKNRSQVMVSVDRFGRTSVHENRMSSGWNDNGRDNDRNSDYRRNDDDRNFPDFNDKDWNKGNDFDFDRDGRSGDYEFDRDGRYQNDNYSRAMSDVEFNNTLRAMEKEWFEKNRARSASTIISSNYFTSAQVKQMLQLFTFEDIKLDLAKQAYGKTVDQRNYGIVNDVFSFNSSREELARHMRSSR